MDMVEICQLGEVGCVNVWEGDMMVLVWRSNINAWAKTQCGHMQLLTPVGNQKHMNMDGCTVKPRNTKCLKGGL